MKKQLSDLKVAIVYDRVNKFGGAERVLLVLHKMFPKAPLFTAVYDQKKATWATVFPKVYTSFLQNIPFAKKKNELFGWLMPLAFEQFDFNSYDLVISVTSEAAKGIITGTNTHHICYMLTPTRYLWSGYDEYFKNQFLRFFSKPVINYLRWWDKIASKRPDKIIAISTEVKKRIKRYYNRDSEIIFPPVELPFHDSIQISDKDYYLYIGRLVKYKKVDLLIKTFNKLKPRLLIVGVGPEEQKLKAMAGDNVEFLGFVEDDKLIDVYQNAKAFLMPQEEDFGITAIEAQSFGVPVIAYKSGGALDTVVDGVTGLYFNSQDVASLQQAIEKFGTMSFNNSEIKRNAKSFSKKEFQRKLQRSLVRSYFSGRRWH
ncbi:MAG: glycosyltransferase [bacterium]|nr:MAG: glycosyltransferase [bacterium]